MKITFLGAAKNVTGSKHLVETNGFRLLLDCGFYQGRRRDANQQNETLPFDAKTINAVILTHAHLDHCGSLPTLVKNGFAGKIHCTPPTAEIARLILLDSANIQKFDCEYFNSHLPPGEKPIKPIYDQDDVEKTARQFETGRYFSMAGDWIVLDKNIRFKFYDAGHILGSASILLEIKENGLVKNLAFSGDLGRDELPILRAPETIVEKTPVLLMECTYGNRLHEPMARVAAKIQDIVIRAKKNKSKIIVPAFSLGRTQELIYILHRLSQQKLIPLLPIYIDSPLGDAITKIFPRHTDYFDQEFWRDFGNRDISAFTFNGLKYIRSVAESKSLNLKNSPFIVIAGSGMAEGGRILHHLKNNLGNVNNIVLITGFQAQGTLGRKLLEGISPIKIFGKNYDARAKVATLNELSAHADQNGLLNYARNIKGLEKLFLVHAEPLQAAAFQNLIQEKLPRLSVVIPNFGQSVEL